MKIKVRVAGFILGNTVNEAFEEEVAEGTSIKQLFRALDKERRLKKGFFTELLSLPRPPSILLNGDRVVPSQDADKVLNNEDEIAILSPIAGG